MGDSIDENKIDKTFTLNAPKILGIFPNELKNNHYLAWSCAEKVVNHVQSNYQQIPTNEGIIFLALHIERVKKDVK